MADGKKVDTHEADLSKIKRGAHLTIKGNGNIRDLPSMQGKIIHVATPSDTIHVRFDKVTMDGKPIVSGDWIGVKFISRAKKVGDEWNYTWAQGWLHKGITPYAKAKNYSTDNVDNPDKKPVVIPKPDLVEGDSKDKGTGGSSPVGLGLELFDIFGELKWFAIAAVGYMTYKILK